jgi:lysophospholipase L1-like esterase
VSRRVGTLGVAAICVGLTFVALSMGTASSAPSTATGSGPYYLAVGDSVPMWNGSDSYPYQIGSYYSAALPGLQVVDMACSGETTGSMIAGSLCAPAPARSQLDEATAFLQTHQGSVALITIDIGGNDVVNCANGTGIDVSCILAGLTTMQTNVKTILSALRQAAGPSVPIYGMNYFNPFLGDWVDGGAGQSFAVSSVSELSLFNQVLEQAYGLQGVPVADVATAFDVNDMSDLVSSPWGQIPVAVDQACTLLDITCVKGQLEGFGDDPVDAGADVIAQTFEHTIGPTITPISTTTSTAPTGPTTTMVAATTTTVRTTDTIPGPVTTTSEESPATGAVTSTTTSGVVSSSSGQLAFTGTGRAVAWLAVVGLVLIGFGAVLLAVISLPSRRLGRVVGNRR